jgi:hypothetical protein
MGLFVGVHGQLIVGSEGSHSTGGTVKFAIGAKDGDGESAVDASGRLAHPGVGVGAGGGGVGVGVGAVDLDGQLCTAAWLSFHSAAFAKVMTAPTPLAVPLMLTVTVQLEKVQSRKLTAFVP